MIQKNKDGILSSHSVLWIINFGVKKAQPEEKYVLIRTFQSHKQYIDLFDQ